MKEDNYSINFLLLSYNYSIIQDMGIKNKVAEQISKYNKLKVNKANYIEILREVEIYEEVFHSNAIENSTLTLRDTENILLDMQLEKHYNIREVFEAKNLFRVYNYVLEKNPVINIENILLMHQFLIDNIDDEIAGRLRKENENVRVGNYIAPEGKDVPHLLEKLLKRKIRTYLDIADFHIDFERIHPFIDGNGRTGRVIMNWQFQQLDLPQIIVRSERKHENYYPHLRKVDYLGFEKQVEFYLSESLNKRIAHIDKVTIVKLKEYSLMNNLEYSNAIKSAHRQTIPAFRLKGKWHIGVNQTE